MVPRDCLRENIVGYAELADQYRVRQEQRGDDGWPLEVHRDDDRWGDASRSWRDYSDLRDRLPSLRPFESPGREREQTSPDEHAFS